MNKLFDVVDPFGDYTLRNGASNKHFNPNNDFFNY
jgi:hypothetical protein